jgi:nitroreductase
VLLPYFDCAPAGVFSRQHAGYIWRRTQGYVGDTALLLTEALLAAFDDGSDTITTAHLDAVPLSARADGRRSRAPHGRPQPSRRRSGSRSRVMTVLPVRPPRRPVRAAQLVCRAPGRRQRHPPRRVLPRYRHDIDIPATELDTVASLAGLDPVPRGG